MVSDIVWSHKEMQVYTQLRAKAAAWHRKKAEAEH